MIKLCSFVQKSHTHFELQWSDKRIQLLRFSDVQRRCPCMRCRKGEKKVIDSDVMAIEMVRIGSYALKIQFTTGCSFGIYPFTLLREIEP